MSVGGSHLVIHLKLPQCNISNSPKTAQCNISCQKSMSVGGSHLVIHLKLSQCNIFSEVYVGWLLALSKLPQCNISC